MWKIRRSAGASRLHGMCSPSVTRASRALPLNRKLACIIAGFLAIVVCLLVLTNTSMEMLSALRAYVGGEGLWSKGQKDAVYHLTRYAKSGDERDYRRYSAAIAVPLGDRDARRELDRREPDPAVVYRGFVQGRNSPEDIPRMAILFGRFSRLSYVTEAIAIWSEADRGIIKLRHLGEELHDEHGRQRPDGARIAAIAAKIGAVNHRLTPLEDAFSRTLGDSARWFKRVSLSATVVAANTTLAADRVSNRIKVSYFVPAQKLHGNARG